jgi:negative regulator of flagellin synthesis FlgM
MQIYGPNYIHGPQPIRAPHIATPPQATPSSSPAAGGDQLEISAAGALQSQLSDIPDIRADRVASIRQAIADGSYETPDKIDLALERLLDEIG